MSTNYRLNVVRETNTVFSKIIELECYHKTGTKSWVALGSTKKIDDIGAVSVVLQKAGLLDKGKTIYNKTPLNGGVTKNTLAKSLGGYGNLKNCTANYVNKLFSQLSDKYKQAGCVYVYDNTIGIGMGNSVYSCHSPGSRYTNMSMVIHSSGYEMEKPILAVIIPNEGSKLSFNTSGGGTSIDGDDGSSSEYVNTTQARGISATVYTSRIESNPTEDMKKAVDGSMRMFGLPHQFIKETDPRIGTTSNLGRCFAERLIMEAPIICLKPGLPDFLPNLHEDDKSAFVNAIIAAANGSGEDAIKSLFGTLASTGDADDALLYYSIKDAYSDMMAKVNIMCKMMATFLGIQDEKVPWCESATFGTYDWRYYTFKNIYNDITFERNKNAKSSIVTFIQDALTNASKSLMNDTQWIRFYVDGNASFNESVSNSTTSSVLESYTEKLEGIAKELDVISGMTGQDMQGMLSSATSSVDQYIQENVNSNSAFGTLLKRLSSNTNQIVSGGNFLIPEIWSDSDYNKSYSFSITLSTPYGNPKSWFLSCGVGLCTILGLCLPQQLTANTYKSPYLVKCYSPGWFNCNYGIIDSVSIEKGADNSWSVSGLPNEIKVSLSVKDLYSTLSIPVEPYTNPSVFLNTGMLEFLMVNCGIDITQQDMSEKLTIWTAMLTNNFTDRFTRAPYDIQNYFKSRLQNLYNVIT